MQLWLVCNRMLQYSVINIYSPTDTYEYIYYICISTVVCKLMFLLQADQKVAPIPFWPASSSDCVSGPDSSWLTGAYSWAGKCVCSRLFQSRCCWGALPVSRYWGFCSWLLWSSPESSFQWCKLQQKSNKALYLLRTIVPHYHVSYIFNSNEK